MYIDGFAEIMVENNNLHNNNKIVFLDEPTNNIMFKDTRKKIKNNSEGECLH